MDSDYKTIVLLCLIFLIAFFISMTVSLSNKYNNVMTNIKYGESIEIKDVRYSCKQVEEKVWTKQ